MGLIAVIPVSFAVASYQLATAVLLYEYAGGAVDPEIALADPQIDAYG